VVLIATVFLFLSLTRAHELDALKAAGVSLYRVSAPVLLFAMLLSLGAAVFQETALPGINARADEVDRVKIRGGLPRHLQKRNQLWYRSTDTRFWRMELLDHVERSISGLLILEVDADFQLVSRLDAQTAKWTPQGWELYQGFVRTVVKATGWSPSLHQARDADARAHRRFHQRAETAGDHELPRAARLRAAAPGDAGTAWGNTWWSSTRRVSFPFVHLIMALVAIPFALASPRSGGRAVGIGVAIMISVGYWLVHYMALAFAKVDLLPPSSPPGPPISCSRAWAPRCSSAPGPSGPREAAEAPLEALLLLAVGRPVAAPQGLLALLPRLPRALAEQPQPGVGGRRRRRPRRGQRRARRLVPAHPRTEDAPERLLERGLHRDLIAVGHDHAPELGERALLGGGQIQGLDVDQRLIDGDREHRAAEHAGALLVPEREPAARYGS